LPVRKPAPLQVHALDTNHRQSLTSSYPPELLLGLIVYGYATGVFSRRKLTPTGC
jgi:hypothetical protein